MVTTSMSRRVLAELFGTFWLVLCGCGSAVLAAKFPEVGIGLVGVALAFGLAVLTMAYAVGGISGGHFNPAVTFGLVVGGRFPARDLVAYVGAQIIGAILGGAVLYGIASGTTTFSMADGFATNGFGAHSPGGYSFGACLLSEIIFTFGFVLVIFGVTQKKAPPAFAPLAIGLALTLIHLVSIPVTNTSVNPARSTGVAIFAGGWSMAQLPFFWIAPLVGAAIAGVFGRYLFAERASDLTAAEPVPSH